MYELMASTIIRERSTAQSALPSAAVLPDASARPRHRALAAVFARTRTSGSARHAAR
ncbi:MAG TPA: hypothetical protein VGN54_11980 [Mycobacteriales bacterium]|jgi:hypothetical protein|nr:hypothetical protein [Mycobacteriales bacterium]